MSSYDGDKLSLCEDDSVIQNTSIEVLDENVMRESKEYFEDNHEDSKCFETDSDKSSNFFIENNDIKELINNCSTKEANILPQVKVIRDNSLTEQDIEHIFGSPYHKLKKDVHVEDNMVSYIAPNFNELLKKERVDSPGSSLTISRSPSTESFSSTNSGWSSDVKKPNRQRVISENLLPIDPTFLADLEKHTQDLSINLNASFNNLISHTNKMSSYALKSLDVYKECVDGTCDTVDNSIKSMYALMAKCEELHNSMKPVYQIHSQIKEIKRVLDIFEMQILSEDIK